jgi:hypothetical protein
MNYMAEAGCVCCLGVDGSDTVRMFLCRHFIIPISVHKFQTSRFQFTYLPWLVASFCGSPGQGMWDLWWTKWH